MARVSLYPLHTGALTLIDSAFFNAGASGRCAFSGWRGLLLASKMTVMEAPGLTYGCATADASRTTAQMWHRIAGRKHDIYRRPMRLPQDRERPIAANYPTSSQRTMYGDGDT